MRGRFYVLSLSIVSMVFQPVAYGQEKANWASQALKSFVQQNQKNGKSITVEEFWKKNANSLNPYWQKQFAPSMKLQKNETLPKMEVISVKGPQGREIGRLMMDVGGKTVTMDFIGSREKYLRINNTTVTYDEMIDGKKALQKFMKDPIIAAESKKLREKVMKKSIVPTREEFANMTATQRAQYLVRLRLLMEATSEVIVLGMEGGKKWSYNGNYWENLIPTANAITLKDIREAVGRPCFVAGYVGKITTEKYKTSCDPSEAMRDWEKKTGIKSSCPSGQHGCHPLLFPSSSGVCLTPGRTNPDYQQFTKICGESSPVKTKEQQAALIKAYFSKKGQDLKFGLKDGKVDPKDKKEFDDVIRPFIDEYNGLVDSAYSQICNEPNKTIVGKIDQKLDTACTAMEDRKLDLALGEADAAAPVKVGEPCTTEDGKPGKIDKDGKCIPDQAPVAGPAPATAPDAAPQAPFEKCQPPRSWQNENGKQVCRDSAAPLAAPVKRGGNRDSDFPWLPLLVGLGSIAAVWLVTRGPDSKPNIPIVAGPTPAAPPLPSAPPQPAPPTPVPPITPPSPNPPLLPPGATETPDTATPYSPPAQGTR